MIRRKPGTWLATAAFVPLIALVAAGCGSSSGGSNASAATTRPTTATGNAATVAVANSGLGKILVNAQGRTLYLFQKDTGTTSTCTGACAVNWPPLRANGTPAAGSGATAMLATTTRSDGAPQVTYNGHPVYLFAGDQKAGDTNGQGINAFGASWFALSPTGNQVSGQASSTGGGNAGY
ncbi:MAG: hypothetical protein JWL83_2465 [Actinomycetia bacterium]|nr:hypothetical protein [Actinomycetes bacterium]